ncbi:ATP-dependent Clp protease ATP-binding subunit [Candidatus Berkelbacteria bacterium]|nr:ATP-dependent Clp protease ATP-binding subunit [Candidatus Berkelbacteria bacterium]
MIRLEGSRGLKLLQATRAHNNPTRRVFRWFIFVLGSLALGFWLVSLFAAVNNFILGIAQITIGIAILVLMNELHFSGHVERVLPKIGLVEKANEPNWLQNTNLADYVSVELANVLARSANQNNFDFQAFFKVLLTEKTTSLILSRAGLAGKLIEDIEVTAAPAVELPVAEVEPLLAYAAVIAAEGQYQQIHLSHVLLALLEHNQAFANLIFSYKVEREDLEASIEWYLTNKRRAYRKFFWEKGKVGMYGIGRDWASGYTPTLSQFARDVGRYLGDPSLQVKIGGYQNAVDQIEAAVSSTRKANVLLVGEPGIGKKTIINGFAARIASGDVPRSLADKHVMELDTGRLLAGLNDRGELEARLIKVLNDATRAGNIILFVNNFQTLLSGEEGKVGSINAAEILLPYLDTPNLQIIAGTTPADYHAIIARQSAVAGQFNRIDLEEPSSDETKIILRDVALHLEAKLGVFISTKILRTTVEDSSRYLAKLPRPENAIRVLESASTIASQDNKVVEIKDVKAAITQLSKVPVGDVEQTEKEKLVNLEEILHQRVIGQDEAVTAVAQALRRARSGLSSGKRPIGSFMFLGPTGVGKTETAKALAENYFGSEKAMIRLDMSEYQSPASLAQLIGSSTEAQESGAGQLTSAVRDTPFSLVLLDEIEKAHSDILNIFLQILDEGQVKDGLGRVVDFTNTIIIATSNAGSELIRQAVQAKQSNEELKKKLLDYVQSQGLFRPEFLNRFDAIVSYKPLTEEQLLKIVDLQLGGLNKRLKEEGITVVLNETAKQKLATLGYQPEFGARALKRVLQDKVENIVANKLLKGEVQRGQNLEITGEMIK